MAVMAREFLEKDCGIKEVEKINILGKSITKER